MSSDDRGCGGGCGCDGDGDGDESNIATTPLTDNDGAGAGASDDPLPPGCALPHQGCTFAGIQQHGGQTYCVYQCSSGGSYFRKCP